MCSWLPGSGQVLLGFCLKMPHYGFLWASWKMAMVGDCCGRCSSFGASGSSLSWPVATGLFLCYSAAARPCSWAGCGATLQTVLASGPNSAESVTPPVNHVSTGCVESSAIPLLHGHLDPRPCWSKGASAAQQGPP